MDNSSNLNNNNISNTIEELDFLVKKLKDEKKYLECLNLIEKSIILKSEKYGKDSQEFYQTAKDLCEICNLVALSYLETDKKEDGLKYLLQAEKLFKNYKELLNLCYNNIGCYYRFLGKYSMSLQYLENAIEIAYELNDKKKAAETHLNTSTILTNTGKYKLATEQCLACIILIQEYINDNFKQLKENDIKESLTILILAYQTLAFQHEIQHNCTQSLLYYQIADSLYIKHKAKLGVINDMVDDNDKIKLLAKISQEGAGSMDKIGFYFLKFFVNSAKKKLGVKSMLTTPNIHEMSTPLAEPEQNIEKISSGNDKSEEK